MKITDIKLFPVCEEKLKAFVSIVLDDCFMVNDIKVIKGDDGFFISMPSRRKRNGKFKDIAHPLNNETRQVMEQEILAAFEASLDGLAGEPIEAQDRPASTAANRSEGRSTRPRRRRRGRGSRSEASRTSEGDRVAAPERERGEASPSADTANTAAESADSRGRDAGTGPRSPEREPDDSGKSAEEVAEHHLRDSFWGT